MMELKGEIVKKLGIDTNYDPLKSSREHLLRYQPKAEDLPVRSMRDSLTSAIIPLSTDFALQEKYVTLLGRVRYGRLMEDMDLFAVWVVHQHLKVPNLDPSQPLPYVFVTVLVDKITFSEVRTQGNSDIRLTGHASWVGRSSIEVVVWLEQQQNGVWQKLTRALFLMASRNATNTKAAPLNPLVPETDEEKLIFEGGEGRKKRRIIDQKQSIFVQEPNPFEQKLIHDMFVRTIDLGHMAFNQRCLPARSIWMEDAVLHNTIVSYPEDRNAHNTVFGGFLMRHALELSFVLSQQYGKHKSRLVHISDIKFAHSVEVSSILKMHAHVIYTELNYMQIVVIAEVLEPTSGERKTTNMFYYTYKSLEAVPSVMPRTYHEAMWFLDGRRHFQNAMNLDDTPEFPYMAIGQPDDGHDC